MASRWARTPCATNAGVSFNVNDTVSIFGQYNGETRSNYTDNSFRLGVEIRF